MIIKSLFNNKNHLHYKIGIPHDIIKNTFDIVYIEHHARIELIKANEKLRKHLLNNKR